MIRTLII